MLPILCGLYRDMVGGERGGTLAEVQVPFGSSELSGNLIKCCRVEREEWGRQPSVN